jgi:hypothetical protein
MWNNSSVENMDLNMTETWLPVVGYEGIYEVSDHGNVRTVKTGLLKKPTPNKKDGRLSIMLWIDNQCKLLKVHRLVAHAFLGEPPPKHECCHNDGNPANNHVSNLRWDTAAANQADRVKHGTSNRGEQCGTAKLTTEQVLAIRADTRRQKYIAADYGIQESQVSRIKNKVRWAHI